MFTDAEAGQAAVTLYGVSGLISRLPGEYDNNFHLKTENGNEYLLKISRPDEEQAVIDLQNQALLHLHQSERNYDCPVLHPTLAGELTGRIASKAGSTHLVRLFRFLPGTLFADIRCHSPALLESLGEQLGKLDHALQTFRHPAARRRLKWDFKQAQWVRGQLDLLASQDERECVQYFLDLFETETAPVLPELRHSVIHGDINDYNILVSSTSIGHERVSGFIDFGDLVETAVICEPAIAAAYAMLNKADPLAAAARVIKGYHAAYPLRENEIAILFSLIAMRLCMSVVNSAARKKENPDDPYLTVTEKPAWTLLKQLRAIHPRFALYTFREACRLPPCPQTSQICEWLQTHPESIASLLADEIRHAAIGVLDLSPGSLQAEQFDDTIRRMRQSGAELIIGRYNEARLIYSSGQYVSEGNDGTETRTIHIGMDIFQEAETPVFAPFDGVVHSFADNNLPQDYGPTIILEHAIPEKNLRFYTLYGHLSRASLASLAVGKPLAKGSLLGWIGDASVNGGWIPHLHFQIITDMLDYMGNFPGVAPAGKKAVWLALCPDPNLILRIPAAALALKQRLKADILQARRRHFSRNLGLSYDTPIEIVRGIGQYLFDENGRSYLDCVNNVSHVGHCHPRVVEAGQKQMAVLNTNTRYLHENLVDYAERLTSTLPAPLEVCFFVCSGSEANELALRLAQAHTGRQDILVMDHAYHGNTSALINISPYKFNGPGGKGKPDYVHVLPMPDSLRNTDIAAPERINSRIAAFICEPLLSCGGQIILPPRYLQKAYAAARAAGAVCIADEVQTGLGRLGTHFWGFASQDAVPDIVTMGKPLGNGHPIGAVITTREIAESFCNGMEYFNTFGGNPVSCAIGLSVLDVIADENLQQHARETGAYLKQKLNALKDKYACIGDVRGLGLFLGVELVTDTASLTPAGELAAHIVNRMKERGILLSTDGPHRNVIKIKPPLVFTRENCDFLACHLDSVIQTL